jgi:hypothetical protein
MTINGIEDIIKIIDEKKKMKSKILHASPQESPLYNRVVKKNILMMVWFIFFLFIEIFKIKTYFMLKYQKNKLVNEFLKQ